MRYLLLVTALFLASPATFANVEINAVSGASNSNLTISTPAIYAGIAGDQTNCVTRDGTNVCNNCTVALTECNQARIYDSLTLQITFTLTGDTESDTARAPQVDDSAGGLVSILSDFSNQSMTKGDTSTYSVIWSSLCNKIDGSATGSCENEANTTIRIGVDANGSGGALESGEYVSVSIIIHNPDGSASSTPATIICGDAEDDGICSFRAFHGDQKIYLEEITSLNNFPLSADVPFESVRVYYVAYDGTDGTVYDTIDFDTPTYQDIRIVDDGSNIDDVGIDGLVNDQIYSFKIAMVDVAKNLAFLTDDLEIDSNASCPAPGVNYTGGEEDVCPYIAKPAEVYGLLTEDINCFIATAAAGSSWSEEVQLFRRFRANVLMRSDFGVRLAKFYYNYGQIPAAWIKESETLKTLTRVALLPAWAFAWVSLEFGVNWAWAALALALFALFSTFTLGLKLRKHLLESL